MRRAIRTLGRLLALALLVAGARPVHAGGAEYAGGFKAEGGAAERVQAAASAGSLKSVAGPPGPHSVVVKDGESILQAVKNALDPKGILNPGKIL